MTNMSRPARRRHLNLGALLGTTDGASIQVLTLYIPSKDRHGRPVRNQRRWVLRAATLLAEIGGGVTIMPRMRGGWLKPKGGILWEDTVLMYTYIRTQPFLDRVTELRSFVHRLGRETNQGEVVVEFDDMMFRITEFDPA